jgi:hypothetical protein
MNYFAKFHRPPYPGSILYNRLKARLWPVSCLKELDFDLQHAWKILFWPGDVALWPGNVALWPGDVALSAGRCGALWPGDLALWPGDVALSAGRCGSLAGRCGSLAGRCGSHGREMWLSPVIQATTKQWDGLRWIHLSRSTD